MDKKNALVAFEKHSIRRFYDESGEAWYFSIVDVVAALTDSANPRDYWFKMKIRVKTEDGFELSTICRQFKLKAPDGNVTARSRRSPISSACRKISPPAAWARRRRKNVLRRSTFPR